MAPRTITPSDLTSTMRKYWSGSVRRPEASNALYVGLGAATYDVVALPEAEHLQEALVVIGPISLVAVVGDDGYASAASTPMQRRMQPPTRWQSSLVMSCFFRRSSTDW